MRKQLIYGAVLLFASCSQNPTPKMELTNDNSLQKIEVIAIDWNKPEAIMCLCERKTNTDKWKTVESFPVVVGRNGLAWDVNTPVNKFGTDKIKKEGDGCSPAGVFTLGFVFSYENISGLKMPVQVMGVNDLCVDDTSSIHYNTFVQEDALTIKDYNSFEHMHRNDEQYATGVWVNYNTAPQNPGNGSCIFLHIWKDAQQGTSGCTAMAAENMNKLVHWLDASKNPVLVQYAR